MRGRFPARASARPAGYAGLLIRLGGSGLAAALLLSGAGPLPAAAQPLPTPAVRPAGFAGLSAEDFATYIQAFRAVDQGDWPRALALATQGHNHLASKVIRWSYYLRADDPIPFEEIARFIADNPDWPYRERLQRRAEEAMDQSVSDARVIEWFAGRAPLTGEGRMRLGEALYRSGAREAGLDWLREGWITGNFPVATAQALFHRHRVHLREADHIARLDQLLWDGFSADAERMLPLVPRDYRLLARARLDLMLQRPGVDARIARVPRRLLDDPGLAYERTRWRRLKGFDDGAREILLNPPDDLGPRAEKWWLERRIQAREALEEGEPALAYRLAAGHGQTSGLAFAQAEFLAGWIAHSFLERHDLAYEHFTRLYQAVSMPISLARGAYWAGRAAAALDRDEAARRWYLLAAQYPTTFYGQLAKAKADPNGAWALPPDPQPTAQDKAAFAQSELARTAALLAALGQRERFSVFLRRLNAIAETPGARVLAARLAQEARRPDLSVQLAKQAERDGVRLIGHDYPIVTTIAGPAERALMLAVARQESEFDPEAHSRVGARGVMQLMPGTARMVAGRLNLGYHEARLTSDPGYNARLGGSYLNYLIDSYGGSYLLAAAAYNAGPARVDEWLRAFGDPRDPKVDPVDWIERIPFSETRNYVQRVMEGLQVYRLRLAGKPLHLTPYADLRSIAPGSS